MKALLFCLVLAATTPGCTTAPDTTEAGLGTHRGAVLSVRPDAVWQVSKETLAGMGSIQVEEESRTAKTATAEGTITVRVEPYDATGEKSILRVVAQSEGEDRADLADRIQLAIQRKLLNR